MEVMAQITIRAARIIKANQTINDVQTIKTTNILNTTIGRMNFKINAKIYVSLQFNLSNTWRISLSPGIRTD